MAKKKTSKELGSMAGAYANITLNEVEELAATKKGRGKICLVLRSLAGSVLSQYESEQKQTKGKKR